MGLDCGRFCGRFLVAGSVGLAIKKSPCGDLRLGSGGVTGIQTLDLCLAKAAL